MWDLPGPGLEPVSPALAGGFLTTAPPGKSHIQLISDSNFFNCLAIFLLVSKLLLEPRADMSSFYSFFFFSSSFVLHSQPITVPPSSQNKPRLPGVNSSTSSFSLSRFPRWHHSWQRLTGFRGRPVLSMSNSSIWASEALSHHQLWGSHL